MSEYETIKAELTEVKTLLKRLLKRQEPDKKPKEWLSAEETCQALGIKRSTLASYRHRRLIEFRGPRPYNYSRRSVERMIEEQTVRSV